MHEQMTTDKITNAAKEIKNASKLVVLAGAGMSADSGLPTFRDETGYWRRQSVNQFTLASYKTYNSDPSSSWKFYANRILRYRSTDPHDGYKVLSKLCADIGFENSFVFTSNTDQHFQKSGFNPNKIYECHGSLGYMYCSDKSCLTRNEGLIDITDYKLERIHKGYLPVCTCGQLLRPHVLMFGDLSFHHEANEASLNRWNKFLDSITPSDYLVVLEIGVGSTVTTVEDITWQLSRKASAVIQINPNKLMPEESFCTWISLDKSALEALNLLKDAV